MKVDDLGKKLSEAVFKAYKELDGRELTFSEDMAAGIFLQGVAGAIVGALEASKHGIL